MRGLVNSPRDDSDKTRRLKLKAQLLKQHYKCVCYRPQSLTSYASNGNKGSGQNPGQKHLKSDFEAEQFLPFEAFEVRLWGI